ncbi:hypothetical protein BC834DRAFT_349866 [Gloeopeniophorella convolvens]|nr:hypothetical protein BC834DRAFT_349866 [Gloeopeniophorella convolvens]
MTLFCSCSPTADMDVLTGPCFFFLLQHDAQMVSTLYRTHKSLDPQYKVPSLYAFDALARAARNHATKHGLTGDAQPGNSASFLLKLEAVLEGLFYDMMNSGVPEGKEKTKKILDIWGRSNTFSQAVLTRLENVLKGDDTTVPIPVSDAVNEPVIHSTPAPPQAAANPPTPTGTLESPTDPTGAAAVQAALLALLSQARNVSVAPANSLQTAVNSAQPVQLPHLDANQLKLFQQLTQPVAPGIPVPPTQISPPPLLHPLTPNSVSTPTSARPQAVAGPSIQASRWNNPHNTQDNSRGPGHVDRNYQKPSFEENDRDFHGPRGRGRGGFRARGRGRFGDRDRDREGYRGDRFHDKPGSPTSAHGRRSRSRSPPRSRYGGGWRDVKPYSPPHRPSVAGQAHIDTGASSTQSGVDEFGREIRPSSDDDRSMTPDDLRERPQTPPSAPAAPAPSSAPAAEAASVPGGRYSPVTIATAVTPQTASAVNGEAGEQRQDASTSGLQSFDYTTFDPTSPASWDALGKAWAVTNRRTPSQEELMVFVMEFTMANQTPPTEPMMQGNQRGGRGWMGEPRGGHLRGGRGRGFGPRGGRGGFTYGNSQEGQGRWGYGGDAYANGTDAIVLGEHTNAQSESGWAQGNEEQAQAGLANEGGQQGELDAAGGRMQKIGDNWAFVRNDGL